MAPKKERNWNRVWVVAGWGMLGLAVVGLFLPVIPQVPFAIGAAWCFSKGSPRLHKKLLAHKKLGPPIRDWEEHRVIRPKLKALAAASILVGGGVVYHQLHKDYLPWALALVALFLACMAFVLTRPSVPPRKSP